jgi:hypothetical protein
MDRGADHGKEDRLIRGHSLEGMGRHYTKPSVETLRQAMARYTAWLYGQFGNVDPNGDQAAVYMR